MMPALTPYADLVRWRRRFWWSLALNLALVAAFAWYNGVLTGNTLLRVFFFFLFSPLRIF